MHRNLTSDVHYSLRCTPLERGTNKKKKKKIQLAILFFFILLCRESYTSWSLAQCSECPTSALCWLPKLWYALNSVLLPLDTSHLNTRVQCTQRLLVTTACSWPTPVNLFGWMSPPTLPIVVFQYQFFQWMLTSIYISTLCPGPPPNSTTHPSTFLHSTAYIRERPWGREYF